jgi:hypothetical protein
MKLETLFVLIMVMDLIFLIKALINYNKEFKTKSNINFILIY